MKSGTILRTKAQFAAAKLAQLPVIVYWRDTGEIADYGGPIVDITPIAIVINGMYYVRSACEFKIR